MFSYFVRPCFFSASRFIQKANRYWYSANLLPCCSRSSVQNHNNFQTSATSQSLMEFFEDSKLWGEKEIKSGRAWTVDELRIKSNSDLHKLWFVLYKEKNMLLTMEQAAKDEVEFFPSPERIDKVEISMENIEAVVRERNQAYHDLETGETGERPHDYKEDEFGRFDMVPLDEQLVPLPENEKFLEEDLFPTMETVNPTLEEFHLQLREKERLKKRYELRMQKRYVSKLFQKFPDTDLEALQEKYPELDIYNLYKKFEGS